MVRGLLTDEWLTNQTLKTGDDGVATIHGFQGTYKITVGEGDAAVQQDAQLTADGAQVVIQLP
jgi:hypothetical protein